MSNGQLTPEIGKGFLLAELRTGMTFAQLALSAEQFEGHRTERNRHNARKAYDSYLRFRARVALSDADQAELEEYASQLRSILRQLGEKLA
jgi:hypothetical protein